MRLFYASALALLTAGTTLPAVADTLQMPEETTQQMGESPAMQAMPARGMSMKEVIAKFGQPNQKLKPIGKPPITRWIYDGYTVYFEYSYVIQSVVNR